MPGFHDDQCSWPSDWAGTGPPSCWPQRQGTEWPESFRQMTSRCFLGTEDQPVTELHDSLHFTEAAGISVDIPPGTGDRSRVLRPQPSTPWGVRYPGQAPGTRDFPGFQGAHSARRECYQQCLRDPGLRSTSARPSGVEQVTCSLWHCFLICELGEVKALAPQACSKD